MKTLQAFVLTIVVSGLMVGTAGAQALSDGLLQDWQQMRQLITGMANAMPDDKFDYASTPEQRNFGEQLLHVAGGNAFLLGFLGAETSRPNVDLRDFSTFGYTATSKEDILQILSQSFDYGDAVLNEFDDEALLQNVAGPPFMAQPTRVRLVYFVMGHVWDIYGQLAVYLRLNDIVPPASRRGV